jgi:sulfur-oxidizing protein SoxY
MSAHDHVRTLHVIAPVNPIPTVARIHFGARAAEAYLSTRIRLADTQTVLAFAEMSDGSIWRSSASVVVTLGGCLDPVL